MQLIFASVVCTALSTAAALDLRMSTAEHTLVPGPFDDPIATTACYWSGTSPFCAGACDAGYVDRGTDSCGDGACCWTGYKKYCCQGGSIATADDKKPEQRRIEAARIEHTRVPGPFDDPSVTTACYWSGTSPFCAGACDSGYVDSGTSSCGDGACCWTGYKKYCCQGGRKASANDDKPAAHSDEDKPVHHHVNAARIEHTRVPGPFDDPSTTTACYWSGTSPFCAGACDAGYVDSGTSSCGDGACCWTGYKKYCCQGGRKAIAEDSSMKPVHKGVQKSPDARTFEGDYDDLCGDDELICCKPGAEKNKDCTCVKKPSESFKRRRMSQKPGLVRVNDDDEPENDICKEGEHLCCNPGAKRNKECACLPAE